MIPTDQAHLRAHVQAINDCNQRGGRMLSLVDLIEAHTVALDLGAYLAAAMRKGASLLVGARPGGAGKTAVMCALLNFLPDDAVIRPVANGAAFTPPQENALPGRICYLAHEIGAGHYYAYVWGERARAFLRLRKRGHIVVSNLHADTLQETYQQLCGEVGAEEEDVLRVDLKVYLSIQRTGPWSMQRWISQVYESDGTADRLLWAGNADGVFKRQADSIAVTRAAESAYASFLRGLLESGTQRIEAVRRAVVEAGLSPADLSD
ncbi:MAG: hypothetical protein ACK2VD_16780 [Anaerolineae bacterium]